MPCDLSCLSDALSRSEANDSIEKLDTHLPEPAGTLSGVGFQITFTMCGGKMSALVVHDGMPGVQTLSALPTGPARFTIDCRTDMKRKAKERVRLTTLFLIQRLRTSVENASERHGGDQVLACPV